MRKELTRGSYVRVSPGAEGAGTATANARCSRTFRCSGQPGLPLAQEPGARQPRQRWRPSRVRRGARRRSRCGRGGCGPRMCGICFNSRRGEEGGCQISRRCGRRRRGRVRRDRRRSRCSSSSRQSCGRRRRRCISLPRRSAHTAQNARVQPACQSGPRCGGPLRRRAVPGPSCTGTGTSAGTTSADHGAREGGGGHRLQERFFRRDGGSPSEPRAGSRVAAQDGRSAAGDEVVEPAREAVLFH